MAWTQADLDEIEKAIASGTRIVRLDNRIVEYHSIKQLLDARDAIKKSLDDEKAVDSGCPLRHYSYRVRRGKGL